jgi:GNAT superfamily N-acetyltransferase
VAGFDFDALEQAEYVAFVDLFLAAPEAVRKAHRIAVLEVDGVSCVTSSGLPPALFRRVLGLGVRAVATEASLDRVMATMAGWQGPYVIPQAAAFRPPELPDWLEARRFSRGYAFMKFARHCEACRAPPSGLSVRVAGPEDGETFGRIAVEGFGMPASMVPWLAALPGRSHWVCLLAFHDGTAIGGGAVHLHGDHAWIGIGATLPAHRRLGAQTALLAHRLAVASARGAKVAVTETGERVPDKPSHSYRNILRAGFEEMYLRQNYASPAT